MTISGRWAQAAPTPNPTIVQYVTMSFFAGFIRAGIAIQKNRNLKDDIQGRYSATALGVSPHYLHSAAEPFSGKV
jgi:hypothetical protein